MPPKKAILKKKDINDIYVDKATQKILDKAVREGVLDFAALGLEKIHEAAILKDWEKDTVVPLSRLMFHDNLIKEIHPVFFTTSLTILSFHHNQIETIPHEIGLCANAKVVLLHNNLIWRLPGTMGKLQSLTELTLNDNHLQRFPPEMGRLDFRRIRNFIFDNNPITFPNNKVLTSPQDEIFLFLRKFDDARVTHTLDLGYNFEFMPREVTDIFGLRELNLLQSNVTVLPPRLGNLKLKELKVNWENIVEPPPEVALGGLASCQRYWDEINSSQEELIMKLVNLRLESIEEETGGQATLMTTLILSNNHLEELPHMDDFTATKKFWLDQNRFEEPPPMLLKMTSLTEINLSENSISQVPAWMGSIARLNKLLLRSNRIEFVDPELCYGLSNLTELDLGCNELTAVPEAVIPLGKLKILKLDQNKITTLPEIPPEWLSHLDLSSNQIRELPSEWGSRMPYLSHLGLDRNSISTLPSEWSQLNRLETLSLRGNEITVIPAEWGDLENLKTLLLDDNPLSIMEPRNCLMTSLQVLAINNGDVHCPPHGIYKQGLGVVMRFLRQCWLAPQTLELILEDFKLDEVPQYVLNTERYHCVKVISFRRNLLTYFPPEIEVFRKVERMHMDHNQLSELPETFTIAFTSLTQLSLKSNPIVHMPFNFARAPDFTDLEMDQCLPIENVPIPVCRRAGSVMLDYFRRLYVAEKTGRLEASKLELEDPSEDYLRQTHIWRLSLAHNCFQRLEPRWIACKKLRVLRLHDNQLTDLPTSFINMNLLESLCFDDNRFETLPTALGGMRNLTSLSARNNFISSGMHQIHGLTALTEVYLGNNRFEAMTVGLNGLWALNTLSLHNNLIKALPPTVRGLSSLVTLDLSFNSITTLPSDVGDLVGLEYLSVGDNPIRNPPPHILEKGTWEIKVYLKSMAKMRLDGKVDLNANGLEKIPFELLQLDGTVELLLKSNLLTDIGEGIGRLLTLKVLDLEDNRLEYLHPAVCKLSQLQVLKLHGNQMRRLPFDFGRLGALKEITLDYDRLEFPPWEIVKAGAEDIVRYCACFLNCFDSGILKIERFRLTYIPDEVYTQVPMMWELSLARNSFAGTLEDKIATLTQLRSLCLDRNNLQLFPECFSNLALLTRLTAERNWMAYIPDCVGDLGNLKHLNLGYNRLESASPVFARCSQLEYLNLSANPFWSLPWGAMVSSNLPNTLKSLQCKLCRTPAISPSIIRLSSLTELNIAYSAVSVLPYNILALTGLAVLDLEGIEMKSPPMQVVKRGIDAMMNYLDEMRKGCVDGEMSFRNLGVEGDDELGLKPYAKELSPVLRKLDVASCKLTVIPSVLLSLTRLEELDVRGNQITAMPKKTHLLKNTLRSLYLCRNRLKELPGQLSVLQNLQLLHATENQITIIPPWIGCLTNLQSLDLSGNPIELIPKALAGLSTLTSLNMSYKYLRAMIKDLGKNTTWEQFGDPPTEIAMRGAQAIVEYYKTLQSALETGVLTLKRCNLLQLPSVVYEKMGHLVALQLANNRITDLPEEIGWLTKLEFLDLSGNPLRRICPAVGWIESMQHMEIETNQLDNIPEAFAQLGSLGVMEYFSLVLKARSLESLDLSRRGIRSLPKDLSDLHFLKELNLYRNHLTVLPSGISLLTRLIILNVEDNDLVSLPRSIGKMTTLRSLLLQGNTLANVPPELGLLLSSITDLSFNESTFAPLPLEIIRKGANSCLSFLAQLYDARQTKRLNLSQLGLQQFGATAMKLVNLRKQVEFHLKSVEVTKQSLQERLAALGRKEENGFNDDGESRPSTARKAPSTPLFLNDGGGSGGGSRPMTTATATSSVYTTLDVEVQPGGMEFRGVKAARARALKQKREEDVAAAAVAAALEDESGRMMSLLDEDDGDGKEAQQDGTTSRPWTADVEIMRKRRQDKFRRRKFLNSIPKEVPQGTADPAALELLYELEARYDVMEPIALWKSEGKAGAKALPLFVDKLDSIMDLDISRNSLKGITRTVGRLESLQIMDASDNQIESISWRLRLLKNLINLNLCSNRLRLLPSKIGRLINLQELRVDNNELERIPISIGRCTALRLLSLAGNYLVTLPPEIGGVEGVMLGLISLEILDVRFNHLRYLPNKMFTLTSIRYLRVGGNVRLTSPPAFIMQQGINSIRFFLKELHSADASGIEEYATLEHLGLRAIPTALSRMTHLQKLSLSKNKIGALSPTLTLLQGLQCLRLDNNEISELPHWVQVFSRLQLLSLCSNRLEMLPETIQDCYRLRTLLVDGNGLDAVPISVIRLTVLEVLSVCNNLVRHLLPDVCTMTTLNELRVSGNVLRHLPKHIDRLENLQRLDASKNRIKELPELITRMAKLQRLDLRNNALIGLPHGMGKISSLTWLEVRDNDLNHPPREIQSAGPERIAAFYHRVNEAEETGTVDLRAFNLSTVPVDFLDMYWIHAIDFTNNTITSIPRELTEMKSLVSLILSNNRMRRLPGTIGDLQRLERLVLDDNELHHLPPTLAKVVSLTELSLTRNFFEIFPAPIEFLHNLEFLSLESNYLTGLPHWLYRVTNLQVLLLDYNADLKRLPSASGEALPGSLVALSLRNTGISKIPPSIDRLKAMERFAVSCNHVLGLPMQICQLVQMEEMWINHNEISALPQSIGELVNLRALWAQGNHLHSLPPSICELQKLKSLNLGLNQLEALPANFGHLTALTELHIDCNKIQYEPLQLKLLSGLTTLEWDQNPFNTVKVEQNEDASNKLRISREKLLLSRKIDENAEPKYDILVLEEEKEIKMDENIEPNQKKEDGDDEEQQQQMLRVRLIKAARLRGLNEFGESNPYIVLQCGIHSQRSKTVFANLSPHFNEEFVLPFTDQFEELRAEVFHQTQGTTDVSLGYSRYLLTQLQPGVPKKVWLMLEGETKLNTYLSGEVLVEMTMLT